MSSTFLKKKSASQTKSWLRLCDAVLRYAGSHGDNGDESDTVRRPTTDAISYPSSYDHKAQYGTFADAAG